MHAERIRSVDQLQSLAPIWNRLSGQVPFRSWEWLSTWWKHYGKHHELYVIVVRDDQDNVVGIAPWYLEHRPRGGRVIQFLGSGKVCSDHLSVFCCSKDEPLVCDAVAEFLCCRENQGGDGGWDLIELIGLDADNTVCLALVSAFRNRGVRSDVRFGLSVWELLLPPDWEQYYQTLSKTGKRRVRNALKLIQSPRSAIHTATQPEEIAEVWPDFRRLHQARRHSVGETGVFDHPPMGDFLFDVLQTMAAQGKARVDFLILDGDRSAVDVLLTSDTHFYSYQSGMDPAKFEDSPGRVIITNSIRTAMSEGKTTLDWLRGDEEYKQNLRATERKTVELRVVARRASSALRYTTWAATARVKDWVQAGISRTH